MARRKHDQWNPPFAAIGKSIWLKDPEWRQFSPGARDLYALLKCSFDGHNNGALTVFYSQLRGVRGLSSSRTISKAFSELEKAGWIEATERGGMFRRPTKYRLTGKTDRMIGSR